METIERSVMIHMKVRNGEAMPTPEELKEEERKLRQLRVVVSLTMSTISQTTLSLEEASGETTQQRSPGRAAAR